MAYTFSVALQSVFGNSRVAILSCTADANSGSVAAGMGALFAAHLTPISMATWTNGVPKVKTNLNASGTATNGAVLCSSFTNGDVFYLTLYGKS